MRKKRKINREVKLNTAAFEHCLIVWREKREGERKRGE